MGFGPPFHAQPDPAEINLLLRGDSELMQISFKSCNEIGILATQSKLETAAEF